MALSNDETAAHMRSLTAFASDILKLPLADAAELYFHISVQMKYAQVGSTDELYKLLEADFLTMQQLAELSFHNHAHLRGN